MTGDHFVHLHRSCASASAFCSFALLLTPGTRKRPPQSGFVQTGFWEVSI
jgi:hypothetical protein